MQLTCDRIPDIVYWMKRTKTVMELLRQAVKRTGLSMSAVSKRSGVPYAVVYGAMKSGKSITVVSLEKIAAALELEIVIRPKADKVN